MRIFVIIDKKQGDNKLWEALDSGIFRKRNEAEKELTYFDDQRYEVREVELKVLP